LDCRAIYKEEVYFDEGRIGEEKNPDIGTKLGNTFKCNYFWLLFLLFWKMA
jgi:hypothetical protein